MLCAFMYYVVLCYNPPAGVDTQVVIHRSADLSFGGLAVLAVSLVDSVEWS